ncbi:MAG: hypothetical protein KBF73_08035 [Flavobacteriales bacterium]|nr:hypothetical protein [Flavobacteriales bacterium]
MQNPTILELRGNGALVRTFHIGNTEMRQLTELVEKYGEPLETAWFDPAFRWKKNARELIESLHVVSEHRGLFADSRSFLEVRRYGKRRVKYFMEELLGDGLLFPLVQSQQFQLPEPKKDSTILVEFTYGTGCMARFEMEDFDFGKLETLLIDEIKGNHRLVLFSKYSGNNLKSEMDDYLIRSSRITLIR